MSQRIIHDRERQIRSITLWGALLNVFLMALKILSGILIRSSALIADGIHSFSDLATDFVVLVSARLSNRPADRTHPYGHSRFETIAAQGIAVVLFVVSLGLLWSAALSIYRGQQNFPGPVVLVVAFISVFGKEIIFRKTRRVSYHTHSASLYANAWHHRSDALSSVAVLIGSVANLLGWGYADQVAAIVVGLMIIAVAGKIFYEGLVELTEHSADEDSLQAIEKVLGEEIDISSWHELRTRKLGGELFVDVHILVDSDLTVFDSHEITRRVEDKIENELSKPVNVLIHIEPDVDLSKGKGAATE